MKFGSACRFSFTWPGGPEAIGPPRPAVRTADDVGFAPSTATELVDRFGRLAEAGVQHIIIGTTDAHDPAVLELIGRHVIPQLRELGAADPRQVTA